MTRATRSSLLLAAIVATGGLTIRPLDADTYPRQPGIDAVHYAFRLAIMTGDAPDISGDATVVLRATAADVREVFLDLASASGGKGMTVTSVTSAGEPVAFTHQDDRLRLPLAAPTRAGQQLTFTIRYGGVPASGLERVINMHGEPTTFSENWPNKARQWLPMIDHPYDKATGEFIVTSSDRYQVVSNGLLVEEIDLGNGQRRTHWKQSVPIASWLYSIGIARFAAHHAGLVQQVPLQTWVFPQDRERGQALFEDLSRRVMNYFSARIGPYPYEKLANVQAAGPGGGMENATAIFYGEKGVASGRAPVVHEIAHQWWGNSVTERDWDDVWLSEGFATYFTLLFTEHDEGRDAFVEGVTRSRDSILQTTQKLPDTPIVHRNLADMERVLNQLVYQKGGWTLHMLRFLIGTDAFWNGIREYYQRYRDGNATSDDLRFVMEDAADVNLQWFFDQWLRRPGVPRVEGEWQYDAAKKTIHVTVRQTQAAEAFRLSFEIGVVPAAGAAPRLHRVGTDRKLERFSFPSEAAPADVVLDPNVWMLYEPGPFVRR